MDNNELRAALEAILFVSNEPVKVEEFAEAFSDTDAATITAQLEEIKRSLESCIGGFILEQAAGGWRLATRPEHDSVLKKYFAKKGENRLSIAALETLAIVAYKQPVTRHQVSSIRGVNSDGVLRALQDKGLVEEAGREETPGRPILLATTPTFLERLGLPSLASLPSLAPLLGVDADDTDTDDGAVQAEGATSEPAESSE